MNKHTLLEKVRSALADKSGKQLAEIAVGVGYSYATILRIKAGSTDPAFGKVQALAVFLGVSK